MMLLNVVGKVGEYKSVIEKFSNMKELFQTYLGVYVSEITSRGGVRGLNDLTREKLHQSKSKPVFLQNTRTDETSD